MKTGKKKHHFGHWVSNNKLDLLFVSILILSLIIVVIFIHDYGASFDEPFLYEYAEILPSAYIKNALNQPITSILDFYNFRYYGTAYLILGEIITHFLAIFPSFGLFDQWHLINFSFFLLGVYGLYWLCKKFTGKLAAFIAGLLYLTQPLLWGHGVMNPKDTPFATFFILSIASGIKMVDLYKTNITNKSHHKIVYQSIIKSWFGKIALFLTIFSFLDTAIKNFLIKPIISFLLQQIIKQRYSSDFANWIYSKAQNLDSQPDLYLHKFVNQINAFEIIFIVLVVGLIIIICLKNSNSFQRWVVIAGIILGFTLSIRTLGPAAGLLVLVYWWIKEKKKRIFLPFIAYSGISFITAVVLWPALWDNPLLNFLISFIVMTKFPWNGTVRFEGIDFPATSLPWYYLPKLIGLQLSIPVLILLAAGSVLLIKEISHKRKHGPNMISLLWFFIPIIGWMLFRPNTYDNFRQFLFIIPPVFIIVATAIQRIFQSIDSKIMRGSICFVILFPGIISGILLHPYEYIYYNGFAEWTPNIKEKYESDYWLTGFCEAGKYLDPFISNSTKVAVTQPIAGILLSNCMENKPAFLIEREEVSKIDPDYSVISTRWDDDVDYFRWMTPIHTISIGKTELLVIKQK